MEIEKVVADKFGEIIESGFIEAEVKTQLEGTIKNAVGRSLESYSDFGKGLDKKIKEALGIGNLDFSLPEYNQLVCTWVMEIVNRQIVEAGKAQIEANLKAFFQPLEKSEWNISEIIEKFKGRLGDDGESGEITFIRDNNDRDEYVDYYFDKESDKGKYSCGYRLRVNKTGVWFAQIDGKDTTSMKTPCLFGFDSFMFQLFATKAKVIDDSGDVETGYGEDYE